MKRKKVRKPVKIYFSATEYWIGCIETMKTNPEHFMISLTNPFLISDKKDPAYGIYKIADAIKLRNWLDKFIKYNAGGKND